MRPQMHPIGKPLGVNGRWGAAGDRGLAVIGLALVPEDQAAVLDLLIPLPLLVLLIFHFEEVRKVRGSLDPDLEVGRHRFLVADQDLLLEAAAGIALAHDREVGVDVDRSCARNEEELGRVVLQVVGR